VHFYTCAPLVGYSIYTTYMLQLVVLKTLKIVVECWYTRVVQKVLQMLGFHRYKRLILAKFVMLE